MLVGTAQAGNGFFGFGRSIRGSGDLVTESRDLDEFTQIETNGSWDVDVTIGSPQSVQITFDDNLIELVETEVRGRVLDIFCDESISSRRNCRIEIVVERLFNLSSTGSGDISVDRLGKQHFEMDLSGSGDFFIGGKPEVLDIRLTGSGSGYGEGTCEELDIRLSGSGDLDFRDMLTAETYVRISGSGDVKVHATESFDGRVSGSGDITYYGNPKHLKTRVSGSGDIRQR
jgi:hypothetical protein